MRSAKPGNHLKSCCNLAPSMSALKMCIFSNIVMKSIVVDWQTSGVKDLSSLVRCDDSSSAVIRHVQIIIPVVRLRPNVRSHSVLFQNILTNPIIVTLQPRLQGLLAFQYGGGRREDPGT